MATSGTRALPTRRLLRATHPRTVASKWYPTILAPSSRPSRIKGRRSSTVGVVLSTTTGVSALNAASISCVCLLFRFLLLRRRSLLTCSWVAANRSRKNVLFPEACKPTKITSSGGGASCSPRDAASTLLSADPYDDTTIIVADRAEIGDVTEDEFGSENGAEE